MDIFELLYILKADRILTLAAQQVSMIRQITTVYLLYRLLCARLVIIHKTPVKLFSKMRNEYNINIQMPNFQMIYNKS